MAKVKRKQPWPQGVDKGPNTLMQTKCGQVKMLGHVVDNHFYTPDVGRDKWEIWRLQDLVAVPKQTEEGQSAQ